MPRANRHFLPGHVWHITHRCHQRAFLLKFARERDCVGRLEMRRSKIRKGETCVLEIE